MAAPTVFYAPTDLTTATSAERFNGHDHDVDVSFFLNHTEPGRTISQHRHAYPEVLIVHDGRATVTVDDCEIAVHAGHVLLIPARASHGFTNTGADPLQMTSIHPVARMKTIGRDDPQDPGAPG